MAETEATTGFMPVKDTVASVDCVSVGTTESGRVLLNMELSLEMDSSVALDLAMRLIGAVARAQGLDAGERP